MPVSYRETAPTIRTLPKVLPQDGERAHSVDRTEFDAVAFTALKGIVGQIPGCGRRPRKWFTIAHEIGHSVIPHHLVNQRVRLENENLAAENIVLREHLPENRLYSHKRASDLEDSGIVEVTPQFMAVPLHKLIFDTSAINKIAADVDRDAIIKALGLLYRIGITETAISEIIATEDQTLRKALLDVVKRLLAHGNCIMPFNWIIEEHAKAYQSDSTGYDWKRLNVRVAAAEREVARQEFMHGMSEQTRREMKEWDKQYLNIFRNARLVFQNLFVTSQSGPSVRKVTEKTPGSASRNCCIVHSAVG